MRMKSHSRQSVYTVLGLSFLMSLAGCDYWPPALQAQIEHMRSETQALAMEKAQLQGQVADLSKATQEFRSQIDELSRVNREKSAMIMSLQKQLDAVRAKSMKSMSSKATRRKAAAKSTAKPSAKATPRRTPKAPSTSKPASKGAQVR